MRINRRGYTPPAARPRSAIPSLSSPPAMSAILSSPSRCRATRARGGFSLIELISVIAVIAVVTVLAAPAFIGVSAGVELGVSATTVADTLSLARQTALSSNRPVEVRFYTVPAPKGTPGTTIAVGLFRIDDSGPTQIRQLAWLEKRVRMATTERFASLLTGTQTASGPLTPLDPTGATTYPYHYFQYRPDGSTNLAATAPGDDTWHVMLHLATRPPTESAPPANYATVQLDPVTGRTKIFRPGS